MRQYIDTLQDVQGNALVGAAVLVQNYIGGANASIYSDNGLTPILTSTVATGADGQFSFFAADGDYNLVMSKNATVFKTQSPVTLFDGAPQVTFPDTGSANAYAIANSSLEKALRVGLRASFSAANTSTGPSTFAYNGLTAKPLVFPATFPVAAQNIIAGGIYPIEYDGTNWQMRSSQANSANGVTPQETAAGVTPTNTNYPELDIRRYGALTTNTGAQNATAIQTAVSVLAQHVFGELLIPAGLTFNIAQVTFVTMSQFNIRCDGVLVSTQAQQGTVFTDQRGTFQGATTPFKFTSCTKFKLYGKGYINNGFTDALYILSCTDFDISLDLRGNCTNASVPTGNSTLAGVKVNTSSQFKFHHMTVDAITSQNMNNATDVYYQWANNFEVDGCTDFVFDSVLSRKAGYGAFYLGLNNFDFIVTGCIGELCSGTAFTATWNAGGAQPSRATITNNIWRYNQEDSAAIANQSGSNASVAITYSNNVSIFNGWCNCSQGTTSQASSGGAGIGTFQFLDDLTINGNTSFEHTTAVLYIDGCVRVVGAGNTSFSSIATTNVIGLEILGNCTDIKLSSGSFHVGNAGGQSVLMVGTNIDVQLNNWAFDAGQISISGTYTNCKFNQVTATCPNAVSGLFDWSDCKLTVTGAAQQGLVVGVAGVRLRGCDILAIANALVISGVNNCDIDACVGQSTPASGSGIGIQVVNANGTNLRNTTGISGANGPGIAIQGTCDRTVLLGCKGSSQTANGLNMAAATITNNTLISFTTLAGGGPALTGATFLTGMNVP